MRVLVCGGRNFALAEWAFSILDRIRAKYPSMVIIHGGATGADAIAETWALSHGVETVVFRPDWRKHGKAAGPIRNQQMLDEGSPDAVVAFPGGKGTADMCRRASDSGIHVFFAGRNGP